jgi:hypothetical protein
MDGWTVKDGDYETQTQNKKAYKRDGEITIIIVQ